MLFLRTAVSGNSRSKRPENWGVLSIQEACGLVRITRHPTGPAIMRSHGHSTDVLVMMATRHPLPLPGRVRQYADGKGHSEQRSQSPPNSSTRRGCSHANLVVGVGSYAVELSHVSRSSAYQTAAGAPRNG